MADESYLVDVVFPIPQSKHFSYSVPKDIDFDPKPGQRVVATLRSTPTIGFIIKTNVSKPEGVKIKPITEIIDPEPIFSHELFSFLQRLSKYYLSPLGKVLSSAIPSEYQLHKYRRICITSGENQEIPAEYKPLYDKIAQKSDILLTSLKIHFDKKYLRQGLSVLKKEELVTEYPSFQKPVRKRGSQKIVQISPDILNIKEIIEEIKNRAPRQWEILKALKDANGVLKNDTIKNFSQTALSALNQKGIISINYIDTTISDLWSEFTKRKKSISLTADQEKVLLKIRSHFDNGKFAPFLLQGVAGSGKTEIYIELTKEALSRRKSTIILVPEITLTTHLAGRFRGEFSDKIAIWHSALSRKQRGIIWRSILSGDFPVIIGARSAIFLPVPSLGLIIVDEEQDPSFKQKGQDPRYNARDAALLRGMESRAIVVLGSATPSLDTQYNTVIGKLTHVELPHRYSPAPSPIIQVVDLKEEWKKTGNYNNPLSELLLNKIKEKINLEQQVLLLQNRRGYSNVIMCPSCGWIPTCRNCDISLTYHKKSENMICHYCNLIKHPPSCCPECRGTKFLYPGFGTQKVETILKNLFPELNISRLDIDATRERGFSLQVMNDFERNQIQILVGTQMIAKGLDFPNVTLVGVLNADIGLFMPDFRARERVFQLIYQVTGRSGRGNLPGEVVVQTLNPQDFTIRCAVQQNLIKFSNFELNTRNPMNYPPFSRLALIVTSDLNRKRAEEVSEKVAYFLKKKKKTMNILGPAPSPLSKIKNRYRFSIIIKSRKDSDPNGTLLRNLLRRFIESDAYSFLNRRARIIIDIDPLDLL